MKHYLFDLGKTLSPENHVLHSLQLQIISFEKMFPRENMLLISSDLFINEMRKEPKG